MACLYKFQKSLFIYKFHAQLNKCIQNKIEGELSLLAIWPQSFGLMVRAQWDVWVKYITILPPTNSITIKGHNKTGPLRRTLQFPCILSLIQFISLNFPKDPALNQKCLYQIIREKILKMSKFITAAAKDANPKVQYFQG